MSEDKGDCIELDISKFFLINYSKANIHFGPDSQILRDKVRDVRTSSKRLHTQGHKLGRLIAGRQTEVTEPCIHPVEK